MKKFIFAMTICVVAATMALAQPPQGGNRGGNRGGTPEQRAKSQTERLDKLVTLTADQKTKVEKVNLDAYKKMNEAFKKAGDDRDARSKVVTDYRTELEKQYKTILTADQFKKYKADQEERMKRMRERRGQRQGNQ